MNIFICWSKERSRIVAMALKRFVKSVIQATNPWFSEDIGKGARWSDEIAARLRDSKVAIVVLTPENMSEGWIHFEAGAIAAREGGLACPFLVRLKAADVRQPLGQFQHTYCGDRADVLKLMSNINEQLGNAKLEAHVLQDAVDAFWKPLEDEIDRASQLEVTEPQEKDPWEEKIDEVLVAVRSLEAVVHRSDSFGVFARMKAEHAPQLTLPADFGLTTGLLEAAEAGAKSNPRPAMPSPQLLKKKPEPK